MVCSVAMSKESLNFNSSFVCGVNPALEMRYRHISSVVVSGLDVEVRQTPQSFRAPLPCLFNGSCGNVFLHNIQFEHDRFLLIVMVFIGL